jgi:hypothetical protein
MYPLTTYCTCIYPAGIVLVNSFEDPFGDIYGEGLWRKFGNKASILYRNVVALASFNGEFTTM